MFAASQSNFTRRKGKHATRCLKRPLKSPRSNWDIVGNDIPVFLCVAFDDELFSSDDLPYSSIQEAMKFPDFVHAVKPEPHNEVPTGQSAHNNFWDYLACNRRVSGHTLYSCSSLKLQTRIATHITMWTMSDRGIPRSLRMMQGFGVNTYTFQNEAGQLFFVKFH